MSQHLVPFARHDGPGTLLAIVPRDPDTWLSTWILLPPWARRDPCAIATC